VGGDLAITVAARQTASGEQVNVAVGAAQQSPSKAWPGLAQIVLRIVNAWRAAAG
jgi:hypothetical protein